MLSCEVHMADGPLRSRKVLCPKCSTLLLEPLGTEMYDCPICLTCLQAKGIPSKSQRKTLQGLSNKINGSTSTQQEASSVSDCETQGQHRLNNEEFMPRDESIRPQEQSDTMLVAKDEDSQLQCHSATSVANMSIRNLASRNLSGKNIASAGSKGEMGDEAKVSRNHLMQDDHLEEKAGTHLSFQGEMSGDGFVSEYVCVENTKLTNDKEVLALGIDCGMPITRTEKNVSGDCAGVGKTSKEEGNCSNDKDDHKFESEIIRDIDCELSFKYIASSLNSSIQLAHKKRTHRLAKLSSNASEGEDEVTIIPGFSSEIPSLNNEGSDDYEVSFSESSSHDGSDSEFDFPAPSAESEHSSKLTEAFLQPSTREGPHQLEWQDADYYTFQESNTSTRPSIEVVGDIAPNMVTQVEPAGVEKEIAENGLNIKNSLSKIIVSRILDDTTAGASLSLHVPREGTGFSGIKGLTKTEEKGASERCNRGPVSGTVPGKPDCDDKEEGSLVDSPDDQKLKLHGDSKGKGKLLDSSRSGFEQMSQLKGKGKILDSSRSGFEQKSQLKTLGHVQPSITDPSTSTLVGVSQMKTFLTSKEDTKLIKSVANLLRNESSTSSLHDNVVDTSEGIKKRERPAAGPVVSTRGDAGNSHSDLKKELDSGGVKLPYVIEQNNVSQHGTKSEGYYQEDYLGKGAQVHKSIDIVKTSDPKWHHRRKYSSDAAQSLNSEGVANSGGTHQGQGNMLNEDLYKAAARTPERSLGACEQAALMLVGPPLQQQNSQPDLHLFGQTTHTMDAPNVFPASSQSFGFNICFDGSRSFVNTVCSCQVLPHPSMFPMAMPGHVCSCHGCHPVCPVCMPYVHCQHSLVPQLPVQSCSLCLRTTGHYQGHTELGNFHRGLQVQAPCVLCRSPTCSCPHTAGMHDTLVAVAKPPRLSVIRKPKHYPPLPQGRVAPYVVCTCCHGILEVPIYLSVGGGVQKLRCGSCGKVSKFSVPENIRKSHEVSLQASAVESTSEALTSSPPSFEFMVRNREVPVLDVGQSIESSHGKRMHLQNQRGSISSRHYTGSGHHSLQSELTFKVKPSQDAPNAKLPTGANNPGSQDEFFFRSLSRKSEFDSSRSLFHGFKTMSARFGVNNVCNDELTGSDDVTLQCTVDEKEEGLDFGAPRPSDGESLDQRSPESRMRSPEKFEVVERPRHRRSSFGDESVYRAAEIQEDFGCNNITPERSSTSLFALLNQESTKFEINMEKRVPDDEWTSLSPVSKSLVNDCINQRSTARKKEIGQARNLRTPHFMKKGQQYIAAMLTRSLKHRVND